jgi:hypothetical protein
MKNPCGKMRPKENPYEVWEDQLHGWIWYVLKKYQLDDAKPYARWHCFVTSPFCPEGEYGDVYIFAIKETATKRP